MTAIIIIPKSVSKINLDYIIKYLNQSFQLDNLLFFFEGVNLNLPFNEISKFLLLFYNSITGISFDIGNILFDCSAILNLSEKYHNFAHLSLIKYVFVCESKETYSISDLLSNTTENLKPIIIPFITNNDNTKYLLDIPQIFDNKTNNTELLLKESCFKKVALGGTFDHLHSGHKLLISMSALSTTSTLIVGLTGSRQKNENSNSLLNKKLYSEYMESFTIRSEKFTNFVKLINPNIYVDIYELTDVFGPTITIPDIEALVVSSETERGAILVNDARKQKKFDPLKIITVDLIKNNEKDVNFSGDKLSSSLIRLWFFLKHEWYIVCSKFSVSNELALIWFYKISSHYLSFGRVYHTLSHISHILSLISQYKPSINDTDSLILSAFFHDVIYNPKSLTNEEDSAVLFRSFALEASSFSNELIENVSFIILKTKHLNSEENSNYQNDTFEKDVAFFLDFDLAILGSSTSDYQKYCSDVRKEYFHLSDIEFNRGRIDFLSKLKAKKRIFHTQEFNCSEIAIQCIKNIENEILQLQKINK